MSSTLTRCDGRFVTIAVGGLAGLVCGVSTLSAQSALEPCRASAGPDALCGTYTVFEDREGRTGRTLDLNVVVLPALAEDPLPDPIFTLAGGPGQAASAAVSGVVRDLRARRDIVFVDQRGTGGSHQLQCSAPTPARAINGILTFDFHRPEDCAGGLDADLTKYTTDIAMDDLDDVRRWLGYEKINLFGGSYGTRAAFVYLRRHGEHVRTATLRGIAPPGLLVPERFALHSQAAFDRLVADCEADEACATAFPDVAGELDRVLESLATRPAEATVEVPGLDEPVTLRFDDRSFAGAVLFALYGSDFARILPAAIYAAGQGDFRTIGTFAGQFGAGLATGLSIGMSLSVMCAEDAPFFDPGVMERARDTFLGPTLASNIARTCETWPRGAVGDGYHDYVASEVPVLLVSGDVDPVTPAEYGERAARHLPKGLHVVIPNTGHIPTAPGCVRRLMRQFVEDGRVEDLDVTCVNDIRRPEFVVP